jgi:hypothetical protein
MGSSHAELVEHVNDPNKMEQAVERAVPVIYWS